MTAVEDCEGSGNTVRLSGELDIATVSEVESLLAAALNAGSGPEIVVDVSGTTFVDSVTISALIDARSAAGRGGRALRLRGVGPRFERVLGLCAPEEPFERDDWPRCRVGTRAGSRGACCRRSWAACSSTGRRPARPCGPTSRATRCWSTTCARSRAA